MTQEQERPKESPIQFPQIKREDLYSITEGIDEFSSAEVLAQMAQQEPFLFGAIESYSEHSLSPQDCRLGATLAYWIMGRLEKKGYPFLAVQDETSEVFSLGLITYIEELKRNLRTSHVRDQSLGELVATAEKVGESVGFPYISVERYAEEDPILMDLFNEAFPPTVIVGALAVYELKRRQFFADQFKKQFGG